MPSLRSAFLPATAQRAATPLVACAAGPVTERLTSLRRGLSSRAAWTLLLALGPAARAGEEPAAPRRATGAPMVGTATMLPDGTILLQLRAEVPGAVLGDAQVRYAPGDPHHRAVRWAALPSRNSGSACFVLASASSCGAVP